ncbi:MAG: hypothetical protein HFI93_02995 [Lachnospiraceae bacterium]|nr:hypothetical protein [Lachnospiraceae bacterium]
MAMCRKVWKICCLQWRKELFTVRTGILFLMVFLYIRMLVSPLNVFSQSVGILNTPWVFPFLTNDTMCQVVFAAFAIFLFCKAPFWGKEGYYMLARARKVPMVCGTVLYIVTMSAFFVAMLFLFALVNQIPYLEFSGSWGKLLGTLGYGGALMPGGVRFSVSKQILSGFSPAEATVLALLLEWGCVSFLGGLVYCLNYMIGRQAGTIAAAAFTGLDYAIVNLLPFRYYHYSPLSLAKLDTLKGIGLFGYPSLKYAFLFFAGAAGLLLLIAVVYTKMKKGDLYEGK